MNKLYIIFFLLVLQGCTMHKGKMTPIQQDKPKIYEDKSLQEDYVSILKTILSDDSAGIRLQRDGEQRAFIHNKFMRDSISSLQDKNYVFYNVDPQRLMKMLGNQLKDSLDMLDQMNERKTIIPIPAAIEAAYAVDDADKYRMNRNKSIYYFHLPIMGYNRKSAYIPVDYICGSLCGNGNAFLLEKVNGKWVIIRRFFNLWIS
ncbi:hypothetical protein [Sphingobacterium sp. HMA12]|uniref:hypothetical protein n=1 Tax=Sphingobacterium sp. HMA12 TaxID=2050894 RepID=UPI000CE9DC70|nr:hypothetical protein [Sphingobacterium sp. HMA12]